ncbi:anthranilate synthase family protein [Actinomycetes bacterium KLBMP 9759]
MTGRLDHLLDPHGPSFALLHRPVSTGPDAVDLVVGEIGRADRIADIALSSDGTPGQHEVLALLPFRQVRERGFECIDDGEQLITLSIDHQEVLPLAAVVSALPDVPIDLGPGCFDLDDEQYADIVRKVVGEEIGEGVGANFVIKRSFTAEIHNWSRATALTFFRRLLGRDPGTYWTFLVCAGDRTFVGASPERHVSVDGGAVVMNPISGTYRYPESGPELDGVLAFLSDAKETNELHMVLDEELKMMGRVCDRGAHAIGPRLKQMARVAHTEYLIEGRSTLDVREILRETLLAPTVTGGPLESACRVIARHERTGRGFYAGVVALIGRDAAGGQALDSAILIRTADIAADGRVRIGVGATLVRDSCPASEAAETRAKASGLLAALRGCAVSPVADVPDIGGHPAVRRALAERNAPLAQFWFQQPQERARPAPGNVGKSILVIDGEDTFTFMARDMLAATGFDVTVARYDEPFRLDGHDVVIVGPGPGDPRDLGDPKIAALRSIVCTLLADGTPLFAVCLGHQILSTVLGLPVERRDEPNQGVQREVDIFGRTELVGFYNTFSARSATDRIVTAHGVVEVFKQDGGDEVHGLRGRGFASVQCHLASVLSRNGAAVLSELLGELASDSHLTHRVVSSHSA